MRHYTHYLSLSLSQTHSWYWVSTLSGISVSFHDIRSFDSWTFSVWNKHSEEICKMCLLAIYGENLNHKYYAIWHHQRMFSMTLIIKKIPLQFSFTKLGWHDWYSMEILVLFWNYLGAEQIMFTVWNLSISVALLCIAICCLPKKTPSWT